MHSRKQSEIKGEEGGRKTLKNSKKTENAPTTTHSKTTSTCKGAHIKCKNRPLTYAVTQRLAMNKRKTPQYVSKKALIRRRSNSIP